MPQFEFNRQTSKPGSLFPTLERSSIKKSSVNHLIVWSLSIASESVRKRWWLTVDDRQMYTFYNRIFMLKTDCYRPAGTEYRTGTVLHVMLDFRETKHWSFKKLGSSKSEPYVRTVSLFILTAQLLGLMLKQKLMRIEYLFPKIYCEIKRSTSSLPSCIVLLRNLFKRSSAWSSGWSCW